MKQIIFLISLSILIFSCTTKSENRNINEIDKKSKENKQKTIPTIKSDEGEIKAILDRNNLIATDFKIFKIFRLKDTIKADLNGDKIVDYAYINAENYRKEIFVLDGKTKIKTKIGSDNLSVNMPDNFDWIDFWGITDDKETFEIIVKDEEIISDTITKLANTSIFVRKEEVGGGVITFKDNKFIWIHQSD